MAKFAKAPAGKKVLAGENVNEEAVVSSSSGFMSSEDDAVLSLKGRGRGRKANKEVKADETTVPAKKAIVQGKKAGPGRGRKKQTVDIEEVKNQPALAEEVKVAMPLSIEKKQTVKSRGKKAVTEIAAASVPTEDVTEEVTNAKAGNSKANMVAPKKGRNAALKKTNEAIVANGTSPAPKIKGKGRGKKNISAPAAASAELEEGSKLAEDKGFIANVEKTNDGNSDEPVKAKKKVGPKKAKITKVHMEPASEPIGAEIEPKTSRSRGIKNTKEERSEETQSVKEPEERKIGAKTNTRETRMPKQQPKDETESINEKETKNATSRGTKRQKKEDNEEASPKKKAKKEPKAKKTKDVESSGKVANTQEVAIVEHHSANGVMEKKKPQGRKRIAPAATNTEDDHVDGAKPAKSKKATGKLMNSTVTMYKREDFVLPANEDGVERFNLKISSWNVAGLRSWLTKDGLRFLEYELPDIFCIQETKCTTEQMPEEVARIPGYHPYWLCMPGGYAGVAIYSKIMPIHVAYGIGNKEFDEVGRMITAEYEKFHLINVYVPNSGRKLVNLEARMRWEKLFREYVKRLDATKPVVICGDMNVSHQAIDLANPKANTRSAGFTQEERDKMTELLGLGFVDTFRHLYPDRTAAYTYWTYMANARSRNVGWRLDYFIVSERFIKRVVDNCIRSQVMGSDHCPITLFLKM